MTAHNSSQFLYQDCLIADLSIDTQLHLLNIGKYVFRPLSFILAFSSFVLNTLVIIAVARTKSLQYPAMVMISSLAVTDAILPLYIMHKIIELFTYKRRTCPNVHPRPVLTATSALCIQATLGNLAVISRDRYLAVRSPWWYRNHMTKSRAFKVVCIPWCISVVSAVAIFLSETFGGVYKLLAQTLMLVLFAIYVIIIMFCYLRIYFRKTVEVGNPNDTLLKREKRLTNTVAGILLILVLTYFPALLVPFVLSAKGLYKNSLSFRPFYAVFIQFNGVLNPLLSFGRSRNMRKAVRDLFKCSSQVQPSSAVNNNNNNNNNNYNKNHHRLSHTTATTAITAQKSNNITKAATAMTYEDNNKNKSDFTNYRTTNLSEI